MLKVTQLIGACFLKGLRENGKVRYWFIKKTWIKSRLLKKRFNYSYFNGGAMLVTEDRVIISSKEFLTQGQTFLSNLVGMGSKRRIDGSVEEIEVLWLVLRFLCLRMNLGQLRAEGDGFCFRK